jgi:hypothetical protein
VAAVYIFTAATTNIRVLYGVKLILPSIVGPEVYSAPQQKSVSETEKLNVMIYL